MFLGNICLDVCCVVNNLSQHMVDPHNIHCVGAMKLLRYLWSTIDHGLRYTAGSMTLHGCTDADWAGSVVDRKGTSDATSHVGLLRAGI